MLSPEENQRLQRKLDLNEQLIWAGKPIPRAFCKSTIGAMLFGIPWCAIVTVVASGFLYSFWFGDPNSEVSFNGTQTTMEAVSIWFKLGMTAFFIPFIAIGIGMLFAPLWKRLSMSGQIYAITTKRALICGRLRTKSWRAPEIQFLDRCDRRSGTGDLHFTYTSGGQRGSVVPTGFDNLPIEALASAEVALKKIYKAD